MKKVVLLLTVLFYCNFGVQAQEKIELEEYNIYQVLLGDGSQLIISKFTVNQISSSIFKSPYRKDELSVVQSETRKSYNKRNQKSFELQDNFGIKPNVKLVVGEDVSPFIKKAKQSELAAEDAFNEKFGSRSGFIILSRVGFNKSNNQALVSITYAGLCGTCSTNYIFVLSKEKGAWIIDKKVIGWIS